MKKIISLALALALALSIGAVGVFADGDEVTFSADDMAAEVGSNFTYTVDIASVKTIGAFIFDISYDADIMTPVSFTYGAALSGGTTSYNLAYAADKIRAVGANDLGWSAGEAFSVVFTVKDGVSSGDSAVISLDVTELTTPEPVALSFNYLEATFTVVDLSELKELVGTAKGMDLSGFTDATKQALLDEIGIADDLIAKPTTQAAIDDQVLALQAAIDGLVVKPPYILGDLSGDGLVKAADALMALQAASNKLTLTETQKLAGDVNGDNKVTAADALFILQYASNKINKFPIEG